MPKPSPRSPRQRRWPPSAWALLVALLVVVSLTGGSPRADMLSVLLLRPASVLLAGLALFGLSREDLRGHAPLAALLGAALVLVVVQLIPLPPQLWRALPGRELIARIDDVAGLGPIWRPLSLDPLMTRNAMWSLAVPIAALALAVRLDSPDHRRLLTLVLAIGLVSGLLGVLQFTSGANSPLYFYRISNFGSAVGLLANRNHQGVFLASLFPLLAAYAVLADEDAKRKARTIGALAAGAMLVAMILATGSRAGLAAGALGIVGALLIGRSQPTTWHPVLPRRAGGRGWVLAIGAGAFVVFCAVFIGLLQGNSLERLLNGTGDRPELRWTYWRLTAEAAWLFFPVGSGSGSFVRVFQIFEPGSNLSVNYANHAHNDFVEILLDGGLPAALLALAALAVLGRNAVTVWRGGGSSHRTVLGRAAAISLLLLILGSIVDYPMRTPLLAAMVCIYAVWLGRGAQPPRRAAIAAPSPARTHAPRVRPAR